MPTWLSILSDSLFSHTVHAHLIFVDVVGELGLPQLVECDNDQGNEDVDEEEGKDDEVDDVVDGHLCPEPGVGTCNTIQGWTRGRDLQHHSGVNQG